jgi:hypothetical protein
LFVSVVFFPRISCGDCLVLVVYTLLYIALRSKKERTKFKVTFSLKQTSETGIFKVNEYMFSKGVSEGKEL